MERETKTINTENEYEAQAQMVAASLGLTVKVAYKGDRCPSWREKPSSGSVRNACPDCGSIHGDRYRVTLRKGHRQERNQLHGRTGCQERVCWCHVDPQPLGFFCSGCGCLRVELGASLSFDFWSSYQDKQDGKRPGYYNILACVASEASAPTDPDEVVKEYGPMPPSQAVAVAKHAARLQAFFTGAELTALSEVQ